MDIKSVVLLLSSLLLGCHSENDYSESNIKLFAALYTFEPLRGAIKDVHFAVQDEAGKRFQNVVASFDSHGCLQQLNVKGKPAGSVYLKREGHKLVGSENGKKVNFGIGENCLIYNKTAENGHVLATFGYDNKGSVVSIKNEEGDRSYIYKYSPDGKETVIDTLLNNQLIDKSVISYASPVDRYLDYTARANGTFLGETTTTMSCLYEKKSPVHCQIVYRFIDDDITANFKADINSVFY